MILLTILAAVVYANFLEWCVHKYILHGLGRRKGSYWWEHYGVHHRRYHLHSGRDPEYERFRLTSEVLGISLLVVIHLPLAFLSAAAWGVTALYAVTYYLVHRKSHLDPAWGNKWIPWHMDHHRGGEANWCVLFPLADYILGTRKRRKRHKHPRASQTEKPRE